MTAILVRAAVTITSGDFYIEVKPGLYVGDLAAAVGVLAATTDTDYQDETLTPVKNLLRSGQLFTLNVNLKDPTTLKYHPKKLHCSRDKYVIDTVETALVGLIWPVGVNAGLPIDSLFFPTKVTSKTY